MSGPDTEDHINQVYSNQHFQAIGLDYWSGSNTSTVGGFQQNTGISYPLCMDATATRSVYSAYEGLDVSIVIDQNGIVRYRGSGVNLSEITSMINNLIMTLNIEDEIRPQTVFLYQNYPNPFNP